MKLKSESVNTPKIADYTTRKSYQQEYSAKNREAINARKKAWRAARKNKDLGDDMESGLPAECHGRISPK